MSGDGANADTPDACAQVPPLSPLHLRIGLHDVPSNAEIEVPAAGEAHAERSAKGCAAVCVTRHSQTKCTSQSSGTALCEACGGIEALCCKR